LAPPPVRHCRYFSMVSASIIVSSLLQLVKELRYSLTSRRKQRAQRKDEKVRNWENGKLGHLAS